MLQSTAIKIMRRATSGRLTPERLWRATMLHRDPNGYVLPGIDYGEIKEAISQFLSPTPNWTTWGGEIARLEGGVEAIKDAIVHEGGWWVWMRPDRFPIETAHADGTHAPTLINQPKHP
ncbi:hypothetical protein RQP46_005753 [Phenoliferia psychrophenolica]